MSERAVSAEERSGAGMGQAVGVVAVAGVMGYAASVLPIFCVPLQAYLEIDSRAYGLLLSVGNLGGIAAALVGGVIVDHFHAGRVIRWCLLGVAVAMGAVAVCGRWWGVMAAALGVGALFQSMCIIGVNAYLVRLFPERRRTVLTLNLLANGVVGMAFPLLASGLLALDGAVSFAWLLHGPFAVLAVILLGGAMLFRGNDAVQCGEGGGMGRAEQAWHWRDLWLPGRTLALVGLASLHGAVDTALYTWLPAYLLSRAFGRASFPPGWVLAAAAGAYVLSRGLLMKVPERRGRRGFLILPGLLGGTVMLAALWSGDYVLTAAGYVAGCLLWSVEYPAILGRIAEEDPRRFGTASALVSLGTAAGTFLLVNATGWTVERWPGAGLRWALAAMAAGFVVFALGAAGWLWWNRGTRRMSQTERNHEVHEEHEETQRKQ